MLPKEFFEQDTEVVAQELLGCELVHKTPEGITSGIIVEAECYSQDDAASHSYRGQTERTKVMFGPGGYAYVYFTYGMHYCFNVVTGPAGHGQAVLIRALEPMQGIELMQKRRTKENIQELANGPAKLVQAMGITKDDYGKPLFEGNLYIKPRKQSPPQIAVGPRIGIKQAVDTPWRFWVAGNKFVSGTKNNWPQ
jgi:DNA-3-methyladenine glycosylase